MVNNFFPLFEQKISIKHQPLFFFAKKGVEIETYRSFRNCLSIWDFAGHEEYHVGHRQVSIPKTHHFFFTYSYFSGKCSFFFSSASIYLLLFDLSVDIDHLISANKLLYWFFFLQTQVGSTAPIILLGTKFDMIEKNLENVEQKKKENLIQRRLIEINEGI